MSKSSSLRRIQADIRELAQGPSDRYHAAPLEDDMFEWHFTIRGADQTEFEGGIYHGRILLPPEYPFKPPHIIFLTPSGRFEVNTKVCLSFSAYHPELWQPAWGIRLILEALISFLPAPADGAIGAVDSSKEERKRLAKRSLEYTCRHCGNPTRFLSKICTNASSKSSSSKSLNDTKFLEDVKKLHALQLANEGGGNGGGNGNGNGDVSSNPKNPSIGSSSSSTATTSSNTSNHAKEENETKEDEDKKLDTNAIGMENEQPSTISDSNDNPNDNSVHERNETEHNSENHNAATNVDRTVKQQPPPQIQNANVNAAPAPAAINDDLRPSWLSDPLIHGSIVTFAAIAFFLYRKVESLVEELQSLNESEY